VVPVKVWLLALFAWVETGEAAAAAVLTQHFCAYKRRGIRREKERHSGGRKIVESPRRTVLSTGVVSM